MLKSASALIIGTVALIAATACSGISDLPDDGISGTYGISQAYQAASCSPQPLPAPLQPDTSVYVQLPSAAGTVHGQWSIQKIGTTLTVAPVLAGGTVQSPGFVGSLVNAFSQSLARTAPLRTEGARNGGHTFSVTEQGAMSLESFKLPLLPPGKGAQVSFTSSTSDVYSFHDNGPSGPVFTTCTVSSTTQGDRIAR